MADFCPGNDWKLLCDDAECYPQVGQLETPANLMWYTYPIPMNFNDLSDAQYCWVDLWMKNHEDSYPFP
jgi:hypothetical protein